MLGEARQVYGGLGRLGMGGVLGIALALIFTSGVDAAAQGRARMSLLVQPREAATGTHNPSAGMYPLDTIPNDAIISVPTPCVGARRCPLLVVVAGDDPPHAHGPGDLTARWLRPMANKYGLLLLVTGLHVTEEAGRLDTILRQTLQRFAVDPAKIAIVGRRTSGWYASQVGIENPHIFNRIAVISGEVYTHGLTSRSTPSSQRPRAELLLDVATDGATLTLPPEAPLLRRAGYPVTVIATLRGAAHQVEDYEFLGHWLEESWRIPDPAARPAPAVVADPLPLVTPKVLAQMTTFWTEFQKQPAFGDPVRTIARRAHLREVVMPLGPERADRIVSWMTDMTALAQYPLVAAALKTAGLTAQQHDAYRVALLGSLLVPAEGEAIDSTSVLGKNLAFRATHQAEYAGLAKAGINEEILNVMANGCCPEGDDQLGIPPGALGIWRMP